MLELGILKEKWEEHSARSQKTKGLAWAQQRTAHVTQVSLIRFSQLQRRVLPLDVLRAVLCPGI